MPTPQLNRLLAAAPDEVQKRIFPYLEGAQLPLGKVLYESGAFTDYVYFPTECIVSLLYVMEDGDSAEISVVGRVLFIQSDYMTDITLVGLTIVSGDCEESGGGANIDIDAGNISVSDCRFEDNACIGYGAGLYTSIDDNGSIGVT
ncbi:MAG TPA: hypothetical protein VK973_08655, partial [Arenicellales bacterium]|nr:hypothetical protein [Arenicellales bacterium]